MLRAHCEASMKKNLVRQPKIGLNYQGDIKESTCDCEAGSDGRCCHITALLYLAEDLALKVIPKIRQPSTSQPQYWGRGSMGKATPREVYVESSRYKAKLNPARYISFDPSPANSEDSANVKCALIQAIQGTHRISRSMWEDVLQFDYEEYGIDFDRKKILQTQSTLFLKSLRAEVDGWVDRH